MYNIKEMITRNKEKEAENFDSMFEEVILDLNNKIDEAIKNEKFSYKGDYITFRFKSHPKFFKVYTQLVSRKGGKRYTNTINSIEYKVTICSYSVDTKTTNVELKVNNHPNKIEYIGIHDLDNKDEYLVFIR